ncbi:taste receptor type 2 member 40-like [Rana temporaria]|uniref:taste receptor type 2 member 40-like n=1 Tax=Rana temporaria TaxID=8407 RepID=UPI001AADB838|nr:taste receptor type 2 member 40-like [Rana temporaria]
MITPNTEACLIVMGLECIAGLCSSVIIILYLTLTSFRERRVTSCNCILISLSLSNVCYTITSSANLLVTFVWPEFLSVPYVFHIIYYMILCNLTSNSSLSAILSIFYFIKIQQFQTRFLSWIKMKIDTMVPWLILTVLFVSLLCAFLSILMFYLEPPNNSTNATTGLGLEHQKRKLHLMKPTAILNALPFMISLLSASGSAWFLKQQRSAGKFGNTKVKDYQSAVHTMICLVIFYALMYLFYALHVLQIFAFKSWGYWMCVIVGYSFAAIQSGLIIRGNTKIKEALRQLFSFRYILNLQDC